jgi:hypothetical protein
MNCYLGDIGNNKGQKKIKTKKKKQWGPHWVVQPCCRRFNSAGSRQTSPRDKKKREGKGREGEQSEANRRERKRIKHKRREEKRREEKRKGDTRQQGKRGALSL